MSLFKGTSRVASGGVDQTLTTEDITNHTATFVDDGDYSGYSDADEITDSISTGSQIGNLFSLIKKGLKYLSDKFSEYLPLSGGTLRGILRMDDGNENRYGEFVGSGYDTYISSVRKSDQNRVLLGVAIRDDTDTVPSTDSAFTKFYNAANNTWSQNYALFGEHNIDLLNKRYSALNDGTAILANANLNDYITIGNYCCHSNTTAVTLTNSPTDKAFRLEVRCGVGGGTAYPQQWLFPYDDGRIFTRTYNTYASPPSWNNWKTYTPREDNCLGTLVGQNSNGTEVTSKPWFKVGQAILYATNEDTTVILLVNESWSNLKCGILIVKLRSGSSTQSNSAMCKWLVRSSNLDVKDFVACYNSNVNNAKIELWCKDAESWDGYNFTVLTQNSRISRFGNPWTFTNSGLTAGGSASITSGYTQVVSSDF